MSAHRSTNLYVMLHSILYFHLQYNSPLPPPYQPPPHKNSSSFFFFPTYLLFDLNYVFICEFSGTEGVWSNLIYHTLKYWGRNLEHDFHIQELFFLHIFSYLLFTKPFNHYDYPHFYSLSSERLSKLLKTIKLKNVWTHQCSTYACETPKLLSSHCTGFLPDEWLTLERLMYQYLATSCLQLPFKGWSTIIRIQFYIKSHTSWFKKNF